MILFRKRFLRHLTLSRQFRYLGDRRLAAAHFAIAQRCRGQIVSAYPDADLGDAARVIDRAWRRWGGSAQTPAGGTTRGLSQ